MEQVDYKEKYENLIKRIKKMVNCQPTITKLAIESLFPELKEDEDEIVIAALKSGINGLLKKEYHLKGIGGISFDRIIAWLEKQGVKKPTNWLQELEDKLANATPKQLAKWKEKYFKEEPTEWSEEDKKMSRFIGNAITTDGASEYLESKGIQVIDAHVWLDKLKDRVQPKQEWSEDDKGMIEGIIDVFYNNTQSEDRGYIDYANYISWLKNLKDKIQPQPKKDWSEEDEQTFIESVEALEDFGKFELADWLKEQHKNQFLKPQITWKPSDEQMEALKKAIDGVIGDVLNWFSKDRNSLDSLYQDLKKLREE